MIANTVHQEQRGTGIPSERVTCRSRLSGAGAEHHKIHKQDTLTRVKVLQSLQTIDLQHEEQQSLTYNRPYTYAIWSPRRPGSFIECHRGARGARTVEI